MDFFIFSLFFSIMNIKNFFLFLLLFIFYSSFKMIWGGSMFFFSKKFILLMIILCSLINVLSFNCKQNMIFFLNLSIFLGCLFFFSIQFFSLFIFFEMSLIPIILIILLWGVQPERVPAFYYLILYTIFSSFPLFFNIILLNSQNILIFWGISSFSLFCFSLAFLVKLPMFIFHIWLPKAHVEAPTLGSIILAGLLLKLGGFGLILILSCFLNFWKLIFIFICSWGTLISCLICCFQSDSKALVAFSSICHLNFMIFLLFLMMSMSKSMNYFTMMTHGINSSFMFWICGLVFHKNLSRNIIWLKSMNMFSISLMSMTLFMFSSNFGVPPLIPCFQEIIFFSVLINFSWKMWFVSLFYIFIVCYFSLFFLINFFLKSEMVNSESNFIFESFCFLSCILIFNFFLLNFI